MFFLKIGEVDSTNNYVAAHASELPDRAMVIAERQTAGRGQRGNSWESAPGLNLTFTMLWRPERLLPREQFSLSEAVALAITDLLERYAIRARVKWPNDIYVGDYKIAGILIEHSVTSTAIEHSRIGIGLNVNQREFKSNAPNPVSMSLLTDSRYDLEKLTVEVADALVSRLEKSNGADDREKLHEEFKEKLWRGGDGPYVFRDKTTGNCFTGKISDVSPSGPISVYDCDTGCVRTYAFKEIEFVL